MKKIIVVVLLLTVFFTACSFDNQKAYDNKDEKSEISTKDNECQNYKEEVLRVIKVDNLRSEIEDPSYNYSCELERIYFSEIFNSCLAIKECIGDEKHDIQAYEPKENKFISDRDVLNIEIIPRELVGKFGSVKKLTNNEMDKELFKQKIIYEKRNQDILNDCLKLVDDNYKKGWLAACEEANQYAEQYNQIIKEYNEAVKDNSLMERDNRHKEIQKVDLNCKISTKRAEEGKIFLQEGKDKCYQQYGND